MVRHIAVKLNQSKGTDTIGLPATPLVLEHQSTSESSGKLVKLQISGPPSHSF